VIGIIKDFVYNDIYGSGAPLILWPDYRGGTVMAVRFKQNADLTGPRRHRVRPHHRKSRLSFQYTFADENFNALFSTETLIGKLAGVFATLAVFISCLGLFGLAAYTAERRVPKRSASAKSSAHRPRAWQPSCPKNSFNS
jgi:putative ABC transport system permease protein